MFKCAVSLAASAALVAATAMPVTAQDGPRVFTRTGSWTADFQTDACQLSRAFTEGGDEVALAFERNRADNTVRLILVGNAVRNFRGAETIGYRFLPSGEQRQAMYLRSDLDDGRAYFNLGTVFIGPDPFAMFAAGGPGGGRGGGRGGPGPGAGAPPPGPEAFVPPPYDRAAEQEYAAGITGIEFNEGLTRALRLETGSLRAAIQTLQLCADDLLVTWGLDYQQHQTMTRRAAPVGPAWEWVPAGVVGFQDFEHLSGARNAFRVMVDAAGKPTACEVHWPSLSERQNAQICEGIVANGQFIPALDATGQPMASYWMTEYFGGLSRPFGQ